MERLGGMVKEWALSAVSWESGGHLETARLARRCTRELSEAVASWQTSYWQWLCGDLIEAPSGLQCAIARLLKQWREEVRDSHRSEVIATVGAAAENLYEVVTAWMVEVQQRHHEAAKVRKEDA